MMKKPRQMSPKKLPIQARAVATVEALVEAATYILARSGPAGLTANKVADKAGVNIASFYQYFPNKEALLFYIVRQTWERQLARLSPILTRRDASHATRLRDFLREFFMIESAEVELRRALRAASVELREMEEYQVLLRDGAELTKTFIADAVGKHLEHEVDFIVRFVVLMTTSFAERTTDEGTDGAELIRQADLITSMLVKQFKLT
ncbi:TetR/AcrR family transcriptional regulator [Pseudomonas sp. LP_7_YM]|uniref:TetR/AcrR family transcriptional regulator n=1 Tax=Pseudomonas sp. LP_7_YM TaxID=2485137 RepID=UPI00105BF6C0|nr:TetR/AcrR family transcriptional regulator [Pseudomonas sp. LP_7_YM]TDV67556.1 TetR family transcriptional regulator [Pseudomonas sp. LP_7_YM]